MTKRKPGSPIKDVGDDECMAVGDDEQGMDGQRPIHPPLAFRLPSFPLTYIQSRFILPNK